MFQTLRTHLMLSPDVQQPPLREKKNTSLADIACGGHARIVQVDGGQRLRKRLSDLGLSVGMEVCVLRSARGHGPLIIAVRNDTRLALGWGMACQIIAHPED